MSVEDAGGSEWGEAAIGGIDPTGSRSQREAFESEAYERWERVFDDVAESVRSDQWISPESDFEVEPAVSYAFFREEIERSIEARVLEPMGTQDVLAGRHWTGSYIRDAWRHGIELADEILDRLGYFEETDDSRVSAEFRIRQDEHREGLRREYIRAYSDLVDLAADARKESSRAYDVGVRDGASIEDLLSTTGREASGGEGVIDRLDAIGEHRTELLADVYIVAAINRAALTRYVQTGVESVGMAIEVDGDDLPEGAVGIDTRDVERLMDSSQAFRESGHEGVIPIHIDPAGSDRVETRLDGLFSIGTLFGAAAGALSAIGGPGSTDEDDLFTWETAGDDRVCDRCASRAGSYSLEEVQRLPDSEIPPIHPNCRCLLIPRGVGMFEIT